MEGPKSFAVLSNAATHLWGGISDGKRGGKVDGTFAHGALEGVVVTTVYAGKPSTPVEVALQLKRTSVYRRGVETGCAQVTRSDGGKGCLADNLYPCLFATPSPKVCPTGLLLPLVPDAGDSCLADSLYPFLLQPRVSGPNPTGLLQSFISAAPYFVAPAPPPPPPSPVGKKVGAVEAKEEGSDAEPLLNKGGGFNLAASFKSMIAQGAAKLKKVQVSTKNSIKKRETSGVSIHGLPHLTLDDPRVIQLQATLAAASQSPAATKSCDDSQLPTSNGSKKAEKAVPGILYGSFACDVDTPFVLSPLSQRSTELELAPSLLAAGFHSGNDRKCMVTAATGFSTGLHYWEVDVTGCQWGSLSVGT